MDTKQAIQQLRELDKQKDDLNLKIEKIEHQENEIEKELSLYWGQKAYGLKIGDVIEFTKTTWHKTQTIRLRVDGFSIITWDIDNAPTLDFDKLNSHPTICGTRILKGGQLGKGKEYWYATDKECSKFKKIEE